MGVRDGHWDASQNVVVPVYWVFCDLTVTYCKNERLLHSLDK
jgi:hypothetical protein